MRRIINLFFLLYCLISTEAFGQIPEPMKNITTPNVATLGTYDDITVDGYELTTDEFSFNFCGYSGRFYINEDREWWS